MENFGALRCASVDKRCGTCPIPILQAASPPAVKHLRAVIDKFGLDEINMTLAGERMPKKFVDLVEEATGELPKMSMDPATDEEHMLVDALHLIGRCGHYSEEKIN